MKFLVRAPNWIGDAVLARPALEALRRNFPESEIWVAARDWVKDLFSPDGTITGTLLLAETRSPREVFRASRILKDRRFDAGLLLTNSFSSALLFYLAGIPQRWGYRRDGRAWLLTRSVSLREDDGPRHQVQYYLDLITGLGLEAVPPVVRLTVSAEEKHAAQEALLALGLDLKRPVIILNPGSFYGPAKRWPADRYAALGAMFQQKKNAEILITGSGDEAELAESIASRLPRRPAVLTGKTRLRPLLGLIAQAALFITNDSGPMHLANALAVPVVAIFGPTDPAVTRPFHDPAVVLKKDVPCWPCRYRACPFDHRCMTAIEPQEVFAAGVRLLE